ncbi:MAG: serine/threonine-protein kinase [Hyphomicrobiaceae bacterium]
MAAARGAATNEQQGRPLARMDNLLALPVGTMLAGEYRLEQVLGAGGFGITYQATDLPLNRSVAIKEYFPSDFAAREGSRFVRSKSTSHEDDYRWGLDRFISEAKTLAKFDHPNIVKVYRSFLENNSGYMVLKFEEGQSFKSWLDVLGRPPTQAELDGILSPLLDALALIHAQDFLHRDIAPDNIIIRADGSPVLIDFGSARGEVAQNSKTVSALVKPGYSPFEQYAITGKQQGPWTDIYALAATLYHAVTGARPADAPTRITLDELKPASKVARSGYRPAFLAAIDGALRLKIEQRPQSVDLWRRALLAGDKPKRSAEIKPFPKAALAKTRAIAKDEVPAPRKIGRRPAVAKGTATPEPVAPTPAAPLPAKRAAAPRRLMSLLADAKAIIGSGATADPKPLKSPPPAPPSDPTTIVNRSAEVPAPAQVKVGQRRERRPWLRPGWRRHAAALGMRLTVIVLIVSGIVVVNDYGRLARQPASSSSVQATTDTSLARVIRGPAGAITSVAAIGNGHRLAVAGADGSVQLWNLDTGLIERSLIGPLNEVTAIAAADGKLVAARRDGSVDVFDLATGARTSSVNKGDGPVWSVVFGHGDGRYIAAGQDTKIRLASASGRIESVLSGHDHAVYALAYAPDRRIVVSGGADKLVKIWDERRRRLVRSLHGHSDDVRALALDAGTGLIASGSNDKTVAVWSLADGERLRLLTGHAGRVVGVAFSPNGRMLASASEDGTAKLWSLDTGELLATYVGHVGPVRGLAFLAGNRLATAGDDRTIRIWNARIAGYP